MSTENELRSRVCDKALRVAKAEYLAQQSTFYAADNRAMWAVTLSNAGGRLIMQDAHGHFPDMTLVPEPMPEPEDEELVV